MLNLDTLAGLNFDGVPFGKSIFTDENLKNTSFRDTHLYGSQFRNCMLDGADFTNAFLVNASFDGASLRGVKFDVANLGGADFSNADLMEASFVNCHVEARFTGAILYGTNFASAVGLSSLGPELWRAHYNSKTRWPRYFIPIVQSVGNKVFWLLVELLVNVLSAIVQQFERFRVFNMVTKQKSQFTKE